MRAAPSCSAPSTLPQALLLGLRTLRRDLRAGELTVLLLAVLLAVAALTAVAFFADRLQGGLQRDARQLLAGDVVVASDHGIAADLRQQAHEAGLQTAVTVVFPTMARAAEAQGGASRLVSLKAVEPAYPLRGQIETASAWSAQWSATQLAAAGQASRGGPGQGEVWVDAALLVGLGLQPGHTLLLGESAFTITRVITQEGDRGAGFLTFAPRVMVAMDALPATGLVQPASRLNWRLLAAGEDAAVQRFTQHVQQHMQASGERGLRLLTLEGSSPQMQRTIERAESFLRLVALLTALLCAVGVALAARSFAQRHLDGAALWRVLGLSQRAIIGAYVVEFALAGLAASLAGAALGYGAHSLFAHLLADVLQVQLPAARWWPLALGLSMGVALLGAFGLAPVLQLAQVPPLRVMRREVGRLKPASRGVALAGLAGFAALLLLISGNLRLGGIAVGGFAAAVLAFALLAAAAIALLRRLVHEARAPRWLLLATRQLAARPALAIVQTSSLALGLLALVLLALLRTDLIDSWRQAAPPQANNRFVINILPEQAQPFRQALEGAGLHGYQWYPMARGRLTHIAGQPVNASRYADEDTRRQAEREFNLSYTTELPKDNHIAAGQWRAGEAGALSIEQGIAKRLGIQLGDVLRFDIGGLPHEAKVTSIRKVDWGSMNANFFVLYPVADMPDWPVTYLSAYHSPDAAGGMTSSAGEAGSANFDNALVRQFPNITLIDLSSTLRQIQRVLGQVSRAVELLFGFALAAGVVVLFAATAATREERAREYAIMRALGTSGRLLAQVQRAELAGVGLLAGLLASAAAIAIAWALAHYVFDFAWQFPLWAPIASATAGAALAWLAGWWSLRGVLQRPVGVSLRGAAG